MKRVIQVYKPPTSCEPIPPGIGDFIRGACHLKELLAPADVEVRLDISETEYFDLVEYDDTIFHIGDKEKIAAAPGHTVEYAPLFDSLVNFLFSDEEELYLYTNYGFWDRPEIPDDIRAFASGLYRFNGAVERLNAEHLGGEPYEVLSVRHGHFQHEISECGCGENMIGPISSCIESHILPNARHRIVMTSDSFELKTELAQRHGFPILPHRSMHGAFGGGAGGGAGLGAGEELPHKGVGALVVRLRPLNLPPLPDPGDEFHSALFRQGRRGPLRTSHCCSVGRELPERASAVFLRR